MELSLFHGYSFQLKLTDDMAKVLLNSIHGLLLISESREI